MPPLPSTLSEDAAELIQSLQRRQKDLSEYQIPRLRACVGPLSTQQDLATELREDTEVFAQQVEVWLVSCSLSVVRTFLLSSLWICLSMTKRASAIAES
jgi:hypothetical protein